MMNSLKNRRAYIGLLLIVIAVCALYLGSRYGFSFSFTDLQDTRMQIEKSLMEYPVLGVLVFSIIYIGAVALSLPIATGLTVFSGFLFGAILGTAVVTVSATIGATITFLLARFFFRDYFAAKFGKRTRLVDQELTTYGFFDILMLRLMPIVPFVLINIGAGLTKVRTRDYVLATLLGIIPFTFIYVQAGTRLAELESLGDVLSFRTLLTVSLIVFAIALPWLVKRYRSRRGAAAL